MLREHVIPALRANLLTLVLTGLAYPLVLTGFSLLLFPAQAGGSLARDEAGRAVGSSLLSQANSNPAYLYARPSAAGDNGYSGLASGASNMGPTSEKLHARAVADVQRLVAENPQAGAPVPAELVAQTGSGLDPHLSPQAALWQVRRIAAARAVSPERVEALIAAHVEGRTLGLLGEPRLNVLEVNLALDRQFGRPLPAATAAPAPAPAAAPSK
jgi:K+-transporting ATPase ATPase C chain